MVTRRFFFLFIFSEYYISFRHIGIFRYDEIQKKSSFIWILLNFLRILESIHETFTTWAPQKNTFTYLNKLN
jgi:hypothetical protein